jgi:multidrug efflux pump subunit AcrA (membrane-fusion protein)
VFLGLVLAMLFQFLRARWGWAGVGSVGLVGLVAVRGLFDELSAGEVTNMIRLRRKRTFTWILIVGTVAASLYFIEIEDWAGGTFSVRAITRAELRAPVAGFLREVYFEEGDRVSPGTRVARLEVPDLASRLLQKHAQVREADAKLRLLEAGPRSEEILEQRRRLERAMAWHELGRQDLIRLRQVCEKELDRVDRLIAQCQADVIAARDAARRAKSLAGSALSAEQLQEAERRHHVCQALLEQAQAEKHVRAAKGTLEAETELARREKERGDVQSALTLLEAGPRVEEVEAERARLARLQEEARYIEQLQDKLAIHSPVPGLVTTPRLKEKTGQYLTEGELICVIEETAGLEIEITLEEQKVARVRQGQVVALRARSLPFETLAAEVGRVAPAAARGDVQSTVTVHCPLENGASNLRPGLTGHARIYTGKRPIGAIIAQRVMGWFRTEFWI